MNYNTQSHKIPHEILKFQEKMLPLKTEDVQAMLLQSKECRKWIFQQSGYLNLKISFLCPPSEHLIEIIN